VPRLRAGKIKLITHRRKEGLTDPHERQAILLAEALRSHGHILALPRQQKVSDYILARLEKDVPFRQVLREDYVRRNSSQAEIEQIVSTPEFIETARERLGEAFRSEEFRL
jgi:hypothetical protein